MEWTIPFTSPGVFADAVIAKNAPDLKLLAPVGVTLTGDGMLRRWARNRLPAATIPNMPGAKFSLNVEGSGTLKTAGVVGRRRRGQRQLRRVSENMPRLYGLTLATGDPVTPFLAVKWIVISILGMLAIGFALLYRKGVIPMSAIAADGVWKYFPGIIPALRGATPEVSAGACVALLGRNGAGKTTLLRILANLSKPSKGAVTVFGQAGSEPAVRARIGYLGHGIGVYDDLSAFENLILFGQLMNVADPKAAAVAALERVGLTRVRDGFAREFSRGMRQRLAVARAFLHHPEVLLLDEPFTSLDDRAIAVLHELLRDALAKGATIVMSTHQIREAMELATQVALLERGKIVHAGPRTAEMLADPGWLYRTYEAKA